MAHFLLLPTQATTNAAMTALVLTQALNKAGNRAVFFQPIAVPSDPTSVVVAQLSPKSNLTSLSQQDLDSAMVSGKLDDVLEDMVHQFNQVGSDNMAVIAGYFAAADQSYLAGLNAQVALSLNAEMILILDAVDTDALIRQLKIYHHDPRFIHNKIAGFVVYAPQGAVVDAVKIEAALKDANLTCCRYLGVVNHGDKQPENSADLDALGQGLLVEKHSELWQQPVASTMAPAAFRYRLMAAAAAAKKRIVLPEGDEPRTIKAAVICQEKQIAQCVLLAKKEQVEAVAAKAGITLPNTLEIIDPDCLIERYVPGLVERRRARGMTEEAAREALTDTVMLGTMMMAENDVDGLVSGAVHTTANTIRPALQLIKTAPGASLVSSIFFMLMPDQVLVYGDCAVNPNPTAEELADIAIQSADSAKAFGISPRVAMISYSTGASGSGAEVEKVVQATQIAQQKRPDLAIDGPLQYDAAAVESVGRQKAPNSPVAGRANVFIFPDLNTGNTAYKAVQRNAHVVSVGPMLQGLNKPVNDLSRGALVDDIVYTIALTAIQATQKNH